MRLNEGKRGNHSYVCPYCGKAFRKIRSLGVHKGVKHNGISR